MLSPLWGAGLPVGCGRRAGAWAPGAHGGRSGMRLGEFQGMGVRAFWPREFSEGQEGPQGDQNEQKRLLQTPHFPPHWLLWLRAC